MRKQHAVGINADQASLFATLQQLGQVLVGPSGCVSERIDFDAITEEGDAHERHFGVVIKLADRTREKLTHVVRNACRTGPVDVERSIPHHEPPRPQVIAGMRERSRGSRRPRTARR